MLTESVRQADQPAKQSPCDCNRARPLVRADGGYGSNSSSRREIWVGSDRGCMPGTWSRILLQKIQSLDEGRIGWTSGSIQLLSRKESWRMRRSRSGDYQR